MQVYQRDTNGYLKQTQTLKFIPMSHLTCMPSSVDHSICHPQDMGHNSGTVAAKPKRAPSNASGALAMDAPIDQPCAPAASPLAIRNRLSSVVQAARRSYIHWAYQRPIFF